MDRAEFIKNQSGQRLYFCAPEGRPSSSPTVGTADQGGGALTAAATTYVTQDSVSTTIDASAAKGAKSVSVASATGITVGDRYRLTNEYGEVDDVEVEKIDSTTVYLKTQLRTAFDKVTGASYGDFESCQWYYTLQSDDYDALRDMAIATATYTVGGLAYKQRLTFDIVTCPLPNILTAARIYDRLGLDLAGQEPDETRGEDYDKQRAAAWGVVKRRILQHGSELQQWRPAMIVDASDLFEYGVAVFVRICHSQGMAVIRTQPEPTLEELLALEEDERTRAFASISWLDKDDDSAKGKGDDRPLPLDFFR